MFEIAKTQGGYADAPNPLLLQAMTKGPRLTALVVFTGADGAYPSGGLIADAAGDLFGATGGDGTNNDGTVFEIAKTQDGYASTPTTLVDFTGDNGSIPNGGLVFDAAGDLFGTTFEGGASGRGTVFEIAKTQGGYAGAPTTLVSFAGADGEYPTGELLTDAAGDLFGTTSDGGGGNFGTVFEIANTGGGYASAPTTLVSFTGADGKYPGAGLIADAAGDLFGTTEAGGANNDGTVFEIGKTEGGYADTPAVLVSFTNADGTTSHSSLIFDAAGDLFGTTQAGGADDSGTVFEIVKTDGGYADAPTILVSFTGPGGGGPSGGLIFDAAGDLFGTTLEGGIRNHGTAFEIAKTDGGYAGEVTTLVDFRPSRGASPTGALIADAAGDLFGTAGEGGVDGDGAVFEITHSGFVPPTAPPTPAEIARPLPLGAAFVQAMASHAASGAGSTRPAILAVRDDSRALIAPHDIA